MGVWHHESHLCGCHLGRISYVDTALDKLMVAPVPADISRQMARGTREIERAYDDVARRLGGRGGERVLKKALRSVFADLISTAKGLTPTRGGYLRRRVDVRPASRRERQGDFFSTDFGYFGPRPYRKALAVEFGNRNVRESSPLRTTFLQNEGKTVSAMADALSDEINRISGELATKLRNTSR